MTRSSRKDFISIILVPLTTLPGLFMGNQGSIDSEDGPGFADAKADNTIRGPYMSLCSFCRAPTQL